MQNQFTKIKYDSRTNVENMQMKTQRLKHYFLLKQKTKKPLYALVMGVLVSIVALVNHYKTRRHAKATYSTETRNF
jgi:hypothetical protein